MSGNYKQKPRSRKRKLFHSSPEAKECYDVCSESDTIETKTENITNQQTGKIFNNKCEEKSLQLNENSDISQLNDSDSISSRVHLVKRLDELSEYDNCVRKERVLKKPDISLTFIKEIVACNSQSDTDNVCQILSNHCNQILKRIITLGIHHMNICGRTIFTIADFKKGLYFSGKIEYLDKTCEYVKKSEPFHDIKWLNNDNPFFKDASALQIEEQNYMNEITKVLLTENEEVCCLIWKDLETNDCILHLVPYIVNFLSNSLDNIGNDFLRISLLLKTVNSIIYNPYLYFGNGSYLDGLAFTLLRFLLKKLPYLNQNIDCFLLKDSAASLLGKVLEKSKSRKILFDILKNIECIFSKDVKYSFVSHYGALAALNSIGVPAIMLLIPSNIDKYCKYLCKCINHIPHCQKRHSIFMIMGQLIQSHYLLMLHYFNYECCNPNSKHITCYFPDFSKNKVFPALSQLNFKKYFGDSLVHHFPLLNFTSCNVRRKKKFRNRKMYKFHLKNNMEKVTELKSIYKCDEIFDIVPLKNPVIKFGMIKKIE